MSKKPVVAVLATALAVGATSIASARDDDGDGKTIRLSAKSTGVTLVENGQPGVNLGDRFIARGDLLSGGEKVGVAALDCLTLTYSPSASSYQCTSTASLPGGQLTFQSLIEADGPVPSSGSAAVTGGTGRYRAAHGEATLDVSAAGFAGDLVVRLR